MLAAVLFSPPRRSPKTALSILKSEVLSCSITATRVSSSVLVSATPEEVTTAAGSDDIATVSVCLGLCAMIVRVGLWDIELGMQDVKVDGLVVLKKGRERKETGKWCDFCVWEVSRESEFGNFELCKGSTLLSS